MFWLFILSLTAMPQKGEPLISSFGVRNSGPQHRIFASTFPNSTTS